MCTQYTGREQEQNHPQGAGKKLGASTQPHEHGTAGKRAQRARPACYSISLLSVTAPLHSSPWFSCFLLLSLSVALLRSLTRTLSLDLLRTVQYTAGRHIVFLSYNMIGSPVCLRPASGSAGAGINPLFSSRVRTHVLCNRVNMEKTSRKDRRL